MSDATSHFDLAVLGADDPLGEAVLRLLEEREVAIGKLYPLTLNDTEATVAFAGKDWPCMTEAEFDFNQTQALVVATRAAAAQSLAVQALAARPAMPVVGVAGIEPAPAVVVARVLRVIDALAGAHSAEAFVALSVAMAGKVGVDELSNQTRGLFNLASPDPEVFPLQIAFNLMPLSDQTYDASLAEATARLLGNTVEVGYSSIQAPIFFGAAVMLHVRVEKAVDMEKLRQAFARADGVTLMESELPAGIPTPATDAADSDDVFIGRIQAGENHLKLWLVFDPLRLEAAQIVGVVENWIDKPTNSMLT
ncbi:MAG: Asd/ArgC dimerization domain-containing protein [Gallionellaceae bacterium]|nr:Asd/ArgC dimerization domain-containing protein [Gallionellaceae bacterium]